MLQFENIRIKYSQYYRNTKTEKTLIIFFLNIYIYLVVALLLFSSKIKYNLHIMYLVIDKITSFPEHVFFGSSFEVR